MIVATPKPAGTPHTERSGVSGTAPTKTPKMPPPTAQPTRTVSALRSSWSANRSIIFGSYPAAADISRDIGHRRAELEVELGVAMRLRRESEGPAPGRGILVGAALSRTGAGGGRWA